MAKDNRYRNWLFLVYPESAPDNWVDTLEQLHVPCVISPLHDQDVQKDGTPKKPHWHVALLYGGKKSYDQIMDICEIIHATRPEPMEDLAGSLRYFCHLDNEGKAKYRIKDVQTLSGADYLEMIICASQSKQMIRDIKQFIEDKDVRYYSDLSWYGSFYNTEWEACIDHQSVFWKTYLISRADKKEKAIYTEIDKIFEE